jgi:hypothetical protein
MNLTAETNERFNGVDIEEVLLWKIHQGEVKVGWPIPLPQHPSSIGFRPPIIDDKVLTWSIKPCALHLNLREPAAEIEQQVVRKIVSDRPEDAPSALERFENSRLFGYVTAMFRVHA